jgi:hypothetical protein
MTGGGVLKAPSNGVMSRTIEESISAKIKISLKDRKGNILFEEESSECGMEVSECGALI